MKTFATCLRMFPAAAGAGVLLALFSGCSPAKPAPPKPAAATTTTKAGTSTATVADLANQFRSVFDDSLPPGNKGRDPFFPNSIRRMPAEMPKPITSTPAHVEANFRLGGIEGRPGKRLAVINSSYILAVGEDADIKLPTGIKVHIHVVEIGADYAVIAVEGEGTKRLEMYQNKSP